MALLLRRGTQAECDAITPAEGELIYTTDTKQLYAGDGATLGGVLVSADAATTLNSLTDTDLTGASNGNHLAYNSGTSKWEPTNAGAGTIGNLSDVNGGYVNGDLLQFDGLNFVPKTIDELLIWDNSLTANLTGNTTGLHTGPVDGDVIGSVFGDDSTILVDGVSGSIHASLFTPTNSLIKIETPNAAATSVEQNIVSQDNDSVLTLTRKSASDLSASSATLGTISFQVDDSNGTKSGAIILGNKDSLYLMADSAGTFSDATLAVTLTDGKLAVGSFGPATEKLEVIGNIKASGTIMPGVYADAAARDAALTAPTAGQMIYVTDVLKFQGNTDGTITGWVNLN